MKKDEKKPSQIAMRFFYWFCHPDFREEIEGDLIEQYNNFYVNYGYTKANRLFIKEVILLFRPTIIGNFNYLSNTKTMDTINQNKRLVTILAIAIAILFIPLIAMNLTNEVNWSVFDFIVVGVLLVGTGLALEFILRKIKTLKYRIILGILLFVVLFIIWAELAVGIFGTPIAGS
jgi:hypothetical protein